MNESRDVVRLYSQHVKIHAVVLSDDDNNSQTWFEQNKEAGFRLTMESLSARFYLSGQRAGETSLTFRLSQARRMIASCLTSIPCALMTRTR